MEEILTVDHMRKSDAATIQRGTSGRILMQRAGQGIFKEVSWIPPVAIVCGSGNNAGDGYVIASLLKKQHIACTIFLLSNRFSPDGQYYLDQCLQEKISVEQVKEDRIPGIFSSYNTILDCIFGTGFQGKVRGLEKAVIQEINRTKCYTVSVDINSGLNGENGLAEEEEGAPLCVLSDLTVSIGSFQPGHFLNQAKDVMKEKINIPIGIEPVERPWGLWTAEDVKKVLPKRKNLSNKGTYGYVTLMGGSGSYSGAIQLAALAQGALRSGAGVSTVAVPASIRDIVASHVLESTLQMIPDLDGNITFQEEILQKMAKRSKTFTFGMGIGTGEGAFQTLQWLLENYKGPLVIDADGLNLLARIPVQEIIKTGATLVLTPHVLEFARLLTAAEGREYAVSEVLNAPVSLAKAYAKKVRAIVLLKGPSTVVTDGERTLFVDRGCPGMATAGSGDVLSGVLSALLSYVEDPVSATASGAFLNGLAGELAEKKYGAISMLSGDTVSMLPEAFHQVVGSF